MLKLVAFSAILAVTKAGHLLAAAPAAVHYSAAPTVSHVTYAAAAPAHVTYAAAPALSYAAPALSYAAPAHVAVHAPAIGSTHESTIRSLGGNSAVSHYSKAVDTAFSSVRKVDTRVTNDAKLFTPTLSYAAPAYSYAAAAPVVKAAPALSYAAPAYGYAAAAPVYKAAPALSYAAPAYGYAAAAPVYKAAPALGYAAVPAGVTAHTTFTGIGTSYAW